MISGATKMADEVGQIAQSVERLLDRSQQSIFEAAEQIRLRDPDLICTIARGSSDHAATYLKYAVELTAKIPVASIGPSVSSIYGASLKLGNSAVVAISQSGRSPDIVHATKSAAKTGAFTLALTNDTNSPLAQSSHHPIDICAGPEKSVAATKTFVTSIVAGLMLLARWQNDDALAAALEKFPGQCRKAVNCDWSPLLHRLKDEQSLLILGRGPSMAIAEEAALKFKETCQIYAQSYSSAEVLHGPVSLIDAGFPILALVARDAAEEAVLAVADDLADRGADVFITSDLGKSATKLPFVSTGHRLTDPLLLIVSFYGFIERLARKRGLDADNPPNLQKVTKTL